MVAEIKLMVQSSTEIEFEVYKNPAYGQDIVEESGRISL